MAPEFNYEDLLPIGQDLTEYRLLSKQGVTTFSADGRQFLKVEPQAISDLTQVAIHDISHYLRSEHLGQLANILKDPESSPNDRFVALDLLKNANISAGGVLPMCQDTGTAIVMGKKGQHVLTSEKDELSISRGV
jgi:fumarate hydratase, class I